MWSSLCCNHAWPHLLLPAWLLLLILLCCGLPDGAACCCCCCIRDMYAGLEEDEAEGLVARHISAEQRKQLMRAADGGTAGSSGSGQQGGRLVPRQFMMELDMSTWEDMKAVVGCADTLMPQRPRTQH